MVLVVGGVTEMELLRRALLIGCVLPGLWLLRLAPLDPLLTVVPVDFAERQRHEAASVPEERKTEAQRRNAELPSSVYIEEQLRYNVFSAVGPEWDRFLRSIDELQAERGLPNAMRWRTSPDPADDHVARRYVFFRPDEEPVRAVVDKLAAAGGSTYVSFSRPGADVHYRVDRRLWTRQDFRAGAGCWRKAAAPRPAPLSVPSSGSRLRPGGSRVLRPAPGPGARGRKASPDCGRGGRPRRRSRPLRRPPGRGGRLRPGAHPTPGVHASVLAPRRSGRACLRKAGTQRPRRGGSKRLPRSRALPAGRAGLPGHGTGTPGLPDRGFDDPLEPLRDRASMARRLARGPGP